MKSNNNFREQVTLVTGWFKTWSECEQTVALYSLLKKLTPSQAKFLVQVLQQSLAECTEVQLHEEKANNPAFIGKVCSESKDKAILHLLKYLPLLQSGNTAAKNEYLRIIPEVLSHAIENGVNIEESRQLLSYSLIHPAISGEERSNLRMWLGYLEERFTYNISPTRAPSQSLSSAPVDQTQGGFSQDIGGRLGTQNNGQWNSASSAQDISSPVNGSDNGENGGMNNVLRNNFGSHQSLRVINSHAGVSPSSNGHVPLHATSSAPPNLHNQIVNTQQGNSNQQNNRHQPLRRTCSVAPPVGNPNPQQTVTDWLKTHDNQLSRGNLTSTCEHAPLSPQSSVTSSGSGSDSHLDGPEPTKNTFMEEGSGMKDVPVWLKHLRLHKYAVLFRQLSYDEMMNLSEDWLESQGVTKGARHKIILSIVKLRERQDRLRHLEKDIERGPLRRALYEMRAILNTPIKTFTPGSSTVTTVASHPFTPSTKYTNNDANKIAEGDLTSQFTRLMGKVCTQLLVASEPDDESFSIYLHLIDKCLYHEAFTHKQKNLLSSWKQQTHKLWQSQVPYSYDRHRKNWGHTYPQNGDRYVKPFRTPPKFGIQQWSFGAKRSVVGSVSAGHMPLQKNNSLNTAYHNKPGLLEGKQQVTRTNSAPIRSGQLSLSVQPANDEGSADTEINARLDSLCISMTEHALGS